jgi:hypothetical protein
LSPIAVRIGSFSAKPGANLMLARAGAPGMLNSLSRAPDISAAKFQMEQKYEIEML